jgi:hypothetical protein
MWVSSSITERHPNLVEEKEVPMEGRIDMESHEEENDHGLEVRQGQALQQPQLAVRP